MRKNKQVLVQNVIINSQAGSFVSELQVVQNCVKGQRNELQRFSQEMPNVLVTALGKPRQGKVSRKGIASDHVKKINLFFDD